MLLNHEIGEVVEGMDNIFRVVPVSKWAEQTRMTTIVKRMRGKKFRREVDVELPIHQVAMEWIRDSFAISGLPAGSDIDLICQEYPRTGHLAYIAAAFIEGQPKYVPVPIKLGHEQIADLTLRGLWQPYTVN